MKKLCFSSLNCPELTHAEMAALAKQYGFYGIEIRGKSANEHLSPDTPLSEQKEIRKLYDDAGIRIAGLTSYVKLADTASFSSNVEMIKRFAALANETDAEYIRVYYGAGFHPELSAIGEAIGAACEAAKETSAKILMEIHDELTNSESALEVLRASSMPENFGFIYNMVLPFRNKANLREDWAMVEKYIGATHINPHIDANPGSPQCFPQDSEYNLRGLLDIVNDSTVFDGPNVLMWETPFDPNLVKFPVALPELLKYVQ